MREISHLSNFLAYCFRPFFFLSVFNTKARCVWIIPYQPLEPRKSRFSCQSKINFLSHISFLLMFSLRSCLLAVSLVPFVVFVFGKHLVIDSLSDRNRVRKIWPILIEFIFGIAVT